MRSFLCLALAVGACHGFSGPSSAARHVRTRGAVCSLSFERRDVLSVLSGAAALAVLPSASLADTAPMLDAPMEAFEEGEAKRAAFIKAQKAYKKAWRRELSNMEFSADDDEAMQAMINLIKMIQENRGEIPEGVRKMDLDQVYKGIQPRLGKRARMIFGDLDGLVRGAVTVKSLKQFDPMDY